MKKTLAILLPVALGAVLLINGCGNKQKGEKPKGEKLLVMVPKFLHPYYEPCYQGFKDAAVKYGVKTEYRAAKVSEVTQQVEVIESLIARHVDGIAISALDDQALVPVIKEATDAGIKVICFDAPAPSSKALCYIGTMNEAAGYTGGEMMAKYMNGEGEAAVLQGGLGAANLNERFKGFERALKEKAPKIKLVAREDVQGGRMDVAMNKTETLLQAHPNLKAIFAVSAEGAPAASAVLKEQKKSGKILVGGFDDQRDTLAGIRDGTVQFCIAQKTYKMGYLSVETLLDAMAGKPIAQKEIDTGVLIITKDNVDTYMDEMRKEFQGTPAKP
jgi:ribose transport system substrate-binding protein